MIRSLALACGLLAAATAPALAAGTDTSGATLTLTSARTEVSIPGHRTSEFTVARDPSDHDHLVAAMMDWDGPNGTVSCVSSVSRDGGATWVSGGDVADFTDALQHVDPWVTIDASGVASMSCIEQHAAEGGISRVLATARSVDGGTTWSKAKPVSTLLGNGTATKDSLLATADGTLYSCYKETDLEVTKSTDGGTTWSAPHDFSGLAATCNGMALSPAGALVVNWQGSGSGAAAGSFGALSSLDGGATWSAVSAVAQVGTVPSDPPFPQDAAPALAVSPTTGAVFLSAQTYQAAAGAASAQQHADAVLYRSTDGGKAFTSLALPTYPTTDCVGCDQVHPALTVDDTGRLVLELTLSDDQSIHREVWLAASLDQGTTWLAPIMLGETDADSSYASPNDVTPDPVALSTGLGAAAMGGNPVDLASGGLGTATEVAWPYFHRDGGEYFGITTTSKGIVTGWDDHYGDGRAAIWSRLVVISTAQPVTTAAPTPAAPTTAAPRPAAPAPSTSAATAVRPVTVAPPVRATVPKRTVQRGATVRGVVAGTVVTPTRTLAFTGLGATLPATAALLTLAGLGTLAARRRQ